MKAFKTPQPVWITSDQALAEACQHWMHEPYLAVDTEFIRVKTFYPIAGLIQIADRQTTYLIDPLLIQDWQPLAQVFTYPFVIKVFHACLEDLEVCRKLTQVFPTPLADTQLAAALAGFGASLSFQNLLHQVLDIHLPKEETRSDWLERPLTDKQVSYAVADVHFLHKVYPKLMQVLESLGRRGWFEEDCQRLIALAEQAEKPELYYKRIKLAWRLTEQQLLLLQRLSLWREQQARQEDVPRNKIMEGQVLWNIARYKSNDVTQLQRSGVYKEQLNKYGETLLAIVAEVLNMPKIFWPKALPKPLSVERAFCLKDMRNLVKDIALELEIPADLLANKKSLESLLRSGAQDGNFVLPGLLNGWRKSVVAEPLLALLTETSSLNKTDYDKNTV